MLVSVALSYAGLTSDGCMVTCGYLCSWGYLRHLYRYEDDAIGERSIDLQLVAMFPGPLQQILSHVTSPVEKVLARAGLLGADVLEASGSRQQGDHLRRGVSAVGAQVEAEEVDPVKERRRLLGKKVTCAVNMVCFCVM